MSSVTVQLVEYNQASESLVDACANMFSELMKSDVAVLSLCGGEAGLIYFMARAMIFACALDGEYYIAIDEQDQLVGFCLWMPPGKEIFNNDVQRGLGLHDFMEQLPDVGKEYYRTTYFAEFPTFVAKCLGKVNWKSEYWWLHTLMVRQNNQRQGVGRALIQPVLDKAAKASEPVALSTTTENNVPKYTGLGLHLVDTKTLPSPWGEWPLFVFSLDPRIP